ALAGLVPARAGPRPLSLPAGAGPLPARAGPLPACAGLLLARAGLLLARAGSLLARAGSLLAGAGSLRAVSRALCRDSGRGRLRVHRGTGLRGRCLGGFFGGEGGGVLSVGRLHGSFWAAFSTRGPRRVLRVLLCLGIRHFGIVCLSCPIGVWPETHQPTIWPTPAAAGHDAA